MTWGLVAVAGATVVSGVLSSKDAKAAAGEASDATLQVAQAAEALNRERYAEAQGYLSPFISRELQASDRLMQELGFAPAQQFMGPVQQGATTPGAIPPAASQGDGLEVLPVSNYELGGGPIPGGITVPGGGTGGIPTAGGYNLLPTEPQPTGYSYTDTPAYRASMGAYDLVGQEQLAAVNQGAANVGSLYSGSRGKALADVGAGTQLAKAGAETQFYNNYMNMLQNLSNPASTTNIASLGVGQAATIGGQNIAAQTQASNYALQGAAASGAATADIIGGIGNIAGAYLNQPTPPPTAYGAGASTATAPNLYAGYV